MGNGLTPAQSEIREWLEGARFLLRGNDLMVGNAKMYIQIGNTKRALEEIAEIEKRESRATALIKKATEKVESLRTLGKK